ncbi:integrase/recombinase XerD [Clostridium punense]|uniref:Integrase/recombinase XerD n=1 Tax=Clostridium punense TaxID=1054297 RepID=A0ABS4K5T9_9CLOT|nr:MULTISPECIES: site-specific integrase [Clostridium]EQB86556.1 hypothetical protein M918_13775 [Clostridium sp. BL8]MBP2023140.1 integrase/recombinase XerD [Clostridium punense]
MARVKKQVMIITEEETSNFNSELGISYSIDKIHQLFEADMKTRGLRIDTIKFYSRILEAFYKFIPYNTNINEINKDTINQYIKYSIEERGHSQGTIHTNIRGLRTFLYWAMKENYLSSFKIKVPPQNKDKLDAYTNEEIQKLLTKPDLNKVQFGEYCAYVAINIFVYTGCRLSTAINIKIEDINFDDKVMYFRHTKNGRTHTVPIPKILTDVLKDYLKIRLQNEDSLQTNSLPLLVSVYNEQLTTDALQALIRRYNLKRNVSKTSIHSFRRFYCKNAIMQGLSVPKVMALVQHSRPEILDRYVKFYTTDLEDDVEKLAESIMPIEKKPRKSIIKMN